MIVNPAALVQSENNLRVASRCNSSYDDRKQSKPQVAEEFWEGRDTFTHIFNVPGDSHILVIDYYDTSLHT